MKNTALRKLTVTAMLTALAVVLIYINFPIFPQVAFLRYDLGDIPILIVTFMFGPLFGFASTVIVSAYQALFLSADGWFGGLMHIVSTGALIIPAGLIYRRLLKKANGEFKPLNKSAVVGLAVGCLTMTAAMLAFNRFLDPVFYGMPSSAVFAFLPWIGLFNLIKSTVNSLLTLLVYKYVLRFVNKF